jgi:hypothetical protein
MRFSARSLIVILLSFMFLPGHWGCVRGPYILPPTPPEEVKAQLGAVGVVSACFPPEITFREPMGKVAGAATGAATGALTTIAAGAYGGAMSMTPLVGLFCVAAGVALAPAGALVGGVAGAAAGVSPEKRKAARETVDAACMGVKFQEMMRDCVIQVGREQTRRPLIGLEEGGPTADGEQVSYRHLGAKGVDTVLEISLLKFGLEGEGIVNPPLALTMTERTRLIRAVDGKVLYEHRLTYSGVKREFVDWATDNAQPLREELERCYRHLAERIIEEAFLLYVPGESEEYHRGEWSAEGLKK